MKKLLIVVLVLLIVGAAVWFLKDTVVKPEKAALTELVPQDVAFYYSLENLETIWDDIKTSRFWGELTSLSTWTDLQVASGIQDLKNQFKQNIGIELSEENLMNLAGQQLIIALTPGTDANVPPQIELLCQGKSKQALSTIIDPIIAKIKEDDPTRVEEIAHEKSTITKIKALTADQPDVYLTIHKSTLIIGLGDSLACVQKTLALAAGSKDASLANTARFKDIAAKAATKKNLAGLFFIDFTKMKDYFQALTLPGPAGTPATTATGLETINYMGGWTEIKEGLITKIYIYPNTEGLDPEMKKMWETAPAVPESLRLIPEKAMLYFVSGSLDLASMWKLWQETLIKAQTPEQTQPILDGITNFETAWGIDLETDVFPLLGNEAAFVFSDIITEGLVPIPKLGLILKIKDQEKTSKLIADLVAKNNEKATTETAAAQVPKPAEEGVTETAAAELEEDIADRPTPGLRMQINLTEETYEEQPITAVQLPLMGTGLAPGYTYLDNFLIIGATTKTLQEIIDVKKGKKKPLTQDPLYQQIAADLPKENNQASYINMERLMEIGVDICNWIISFQQLSIPQGPPPEDPDEAKAFNQRKAQAEATITTIKDNVIPILTTLKAAKVIATAAENKKDHIEQTLILRVEDL